MIYLINNDKYEIIKREIQHAKFEKVLDYFEDKKVITLDIETTPKEGFKNYDQAGLDPYTSDIVSLQLGDHQNQFVLDVRYLTELQRTILVHELLSREDVL